MTANSTTGMLLVATPETKSSPFLRSVLFVLHHDASGAVGIVINRPTRLDVGELLPRWEDSLTEPRVIFEAGPVEPNGFIGLAEVSRVEPEGSTPVGGSGKLATIDLEGDPAIAAAGVSRLRIYRGYAGWAAGQLDAEIRAGAWFVVSSRDSDLWQVDSSGLREQVLRRQAEPIRWFVHAPDDPAVN